MANKKANLEHLALELESVEKGKREQGVACDYGNIIAHARNDEYPRSSLIKELVDSNLKWFAKKVLDGYYEAERQQEEYDNRKVSETIEADTPEVADPAEGIR